MLVVPLAFGQNKGFLPAASSEVLVSSGVSAPPAKEAAAKPNPLGDHYLMLVAGNRPQLLTPSQLAVFNQSPYDGLAVRFLAQYDTQAPLPVPDMVSQLLQLKKSSPKEFWPWVSLNRMVGVDPDSDSPYRRDPYFTRTHGLDLDDTTGAQHDFLQMWGDCLRAANQSHVPGIVADLELYVNYKAYEPELLAKQIGKPLPETLDLLHRLGTRMADTAAKEYPDAAIWFFFTDLGQYGWKVYDGIKYYPTPAYIILGMLDRIREKHYHLKIISGGEVSLEYCSFSLQHLKHRMEVRANDYAPHFQNYGASLELAGTMLLWTERKAKTGFVAEGACAKSDADTAEDLEPYLELLLKTYRYNWIYATHNSGYDPFNADTAPRFNAVINQAQAAAKSTGSAK